jgi:TolB protein
MLWFQNGERLSVYDVGAGNIELELQDAPGFFQAPAWSPVDQRLLFARSERQRNHVTIADGDVRAELGRPLAGAVFFSWSPDGEHIAFASGTYPLSPITIVGSDGSNERVISGVENIIAFFWSPDSTKLAVVSVEEATEPLPEAQGPGFHGRRAAQTDTPDLTLVWHVIDVGTGEASRLATFFPTREQFYLLQFFDQYSQSHRLWSPDSRYLVYAEQPAGAEVGSIRLLDTTQPDQSPRVLMEGRQAVFSFGN